jgi:arylsulfatase A-like enzyme
MFWRIFNFFISNFIKTIFTGIIAGAFVGCVDWILMTLLIDMTWVTHGSYLFPFLGLAFGIFSLAAVSLLMVFARNRAVIRHYDSIIFSAVINFLIVILIRDFFIEEVLNLNPASISSFILISVLVIISFIIFYYLSIALGKLFAVVRLGWQQGIFILCLIVYAGISYYMADIDKGRSYFTPYKTETASGTEESPNILFIIMDTLRRDYVPPLADKLKVPNYQKLADDGIVFTNFIANCSWTKPSVASMVTSLHPLQHNVRTTQNRLNPKLITLAEVMSDIGYYTIGIHNNPTLNIASNFHQGFNYYEGCYTSRLSDPRVPDAYLLKSVRIFEVQFKNLFQPSHSATKRRYRNALDTTREVIKWLENNKDKKFFMFLHYMDPHSPYFKHPGDEIGLRPPVWGYDGEDRSPEEVQKYLDNYMSEVQYTDEALGLLFDALRELNLYDSLFIVLTSDHGEEFHDHRSWAHGFSLYDQLIHAVLIVKLPGNQNAGSIDSSLVESIDIAPTLVSYCRGKVPVQWEGKNIFSNERTDWVISTTLRGGDQISIRNLKEKLYIINNEENNSRMVKYFNIEKDPLENNDISNDPGYQKRVIELEELMNSYEISYKSRSIESESGMLDEATRKQLEALGYIE